MIQRIQTIFLILFIISLGASFFFPVWQKVEISDETGNIETIITGHISTNVFEKDNEIILYDQFYISAIVILCCLLAVFSIFSYKSRITQIKLGTANSFITTILVIFFLYETFYNEQFLEINDQISFLISFYLIFLAIFFNFLSNRFIRKDELLVRESERIR